MTLHRDGPVRREDDPAATSVSDIGRALRRERTRQGLRLDELAAQTGLPVGHLEALEAGSVDGPVDRIAVVRTLRAYADALGLDGDRYALALIDLWPDAAAAGGASGGVLPVPAPAGPPVPPPAYVPAPLDPLTEALRPLGPADPGPPAGPFGATPAAAARIAGPGVDALTGPVQVVAPLPPAPVTAALAPPAAPVAPPAATGVVSVSAAGSTIRRVGGTSAPRDPGTAQVPAVMADTGTVPAVPRDRRRGRPPTALWVLLGVVVLALAVGIAGLVIHKEKPQWLVDIGVTSAGHTGGHKTATGTHHATAAPTMAMTHLTSVAASFEVHASYFLVQVVPVGGSSWVQATGSGQSTPLFAGTLANLQSKDFLVGPGQTLTVDVGSAHARLIVTSGKKEIGFYFPKVAPFTLTFTQAR